MKSSQYWDKAWSLVEGCTPCSIGCDHCWSREMGKRFGKWPEKVAFRKDRLDLPLKTRKPTVFAIWNDLFHEEITGQSILSTLATIALAPRHTFLALTKRAIRLNHFMTFFDGWEEWKETLASRAYMLYGEQAECIVANAISEVLGEGYNVGWPMKNLWHGLTICTQAEADEKIPELLKVPGKRWLSIEPMLGPINLAIIPNKYALGEGQRYYDPLKRLAWYATNDFSYYDVCNCREGVDFVVVGCETGPHRRPCKLEWIQSIVDQCRAAGVLVFVKQIEIERRVSHDMTEWPESLRVRELPWKKEQF